MNYWRRYPADYANDTRHLSYAEHGIYALLLDWYYASEKPLPKNRKTVHQRLCAKTKAERTLIDKVLKEFFTLTRQGFRQSRADIEINHFKRLSATRSVSGRKGGYSWKQMLAGGYKHLPTKKGVSPTPTLEETSSTTTVLNSSKSGEGTSGRFAASSPDPSRKNGKKLTKPQQRYADTSRLIDEAQRIKENEPNIDASSLAEDLKRLAARKDMNYDGQMIDNAINIADRRQKEK